MELMEPKLNNPLQLISTYNSDSEDSEEEIVSKTLSSGKRKFKNQNNGNNLKRLPLPSIIGNLYNNDSIHKDNPEEHDGRIRSFPHERGNWSTYVYFPISESTILERIINPLLNEYDNLEIIKDPHISLTRTVILRHHWIESFIQTLQSKLKGFSNFSITFNSLKIYTNEENTRSFIGLTVGKGEKELINLIEALDACLAEFKLKPFYKKPSFHASILWALGELKDKDKLLDRYNQIFQESFNNDPEEWTFNIKYLKCKTGNKVYKFNLK